MKKHLFTWKTALVLTSFSLSPLAHADVASTEVVGEVEQPTPQLEFVSPQEPYGDLNEADEADDDDETPQGTPVSQSSNSAEKAKKKEFWKNIILATTAVIVAVISILVVSND